MSYNHLPYWLFGNLNPSVVIHPSAIANFAASIVVLGFLAVVAIITYYKAWGYLWREWLTTMDHKKIGIIYTVIAFVMMSRGVAEAAVMRTQQAVAIDHTGIVTADHYAQLFSTHGTIMIFFMAMPFLTGLANFVVPLQIGARDVSFPFMNAVSLWLAAAGAVLLMVSLVVGEFGTGGWTAYPPFTEISFSPGEGVDYWIWAVTLSGISSTLSAINLAVTIYKERAPGMHLMRMPLFTWTILCTSILMIFAMPAITVASAMLALDRYAGFHFFTNAAGGDMMNYINMFWLFGHPEVYILILPAFGIYSEVIPTFTAKRIFGYASLVIATMAIAVLSFTVWLHHFFTMGQSANVNAVFGIATMLIAVPTGVKIYDWLLTMAGGRIRLTVPMLFSISFMVNFVIGGLTGVILANPTIDFQVHNSLFLVAHFHNMLIPGMLFGLIAGYQYWFPKAFGFTLDERWGKISFWCWTLGFMLAFYPLYVIGVMGGLRRTVEFFQPEYRPWLIIALIGAGLVLMGLTALFVQLWVSIATRKERMVPGGDPWDGRSLEWAIPCPAPEVNFYATPKVEALDPWWWEKQHGLAYREAEHYDPIHLPDNSAQPLITGVAAGVVGFALTWQVWWLVIVALLVALGTMVVRSFKLHHGHEVPAVEVAREHREWLEQVRAIKPVDRFEEHSPANKGVADSMATLAVHS